MIKGAYRAYTEICNLVIELVRQFYDEPRAFRITGDNGSPEYIEFNNAGMQSIVSNEFGLDFATKEPVFDIKVKAQRSNPYSRMSQNELAMQFYQSGFFNPQLSDQALATIDMMDFEGKERVRETIRNNGTLFEQLQQAKQMQLQLAQALAEANGDTRPLMALQQQMGITQPAGTQATPGGGIEEPVKGRTAGETRYLRAADRAKEATEVR